MNPLEAEKLGDAVEIVATELSRADEHISDAKSALVHLMKTNPPAERAAWGRDIAEKMSNIYYGVQNIADSIKALREAHRDIFIAIGDTEVDRAKADPVPEPSQINRPRIDPSTDS